MITTATLAIASAHGAYVTLPMYAIAGTVDVFAWGAVRTWARSYR